MPSKLKHANAPSYKAMSHRDISEVEPEGSSALAVGSRTLFLETVRRSNAACQNGDYGLAATLYTEALALDPLSHVLYSNRSAAYLKMGMFAQALQDAVRATELSPEWPKAYYRQGVALQCLGRYGEALVAFSVGLAREPDNRQLLSGLVEASLKSPLRVTLEPTFQQLRAMKLDESPFVVISVVGQELLGQASTVGQYRAAAGVLEAALAIGSCSLKLRGSVFSALSSAYWALNSLEKAIRFMQKDLEVARSLGDTSGECRAYGNLGSAYFSQGRYEEALTAHRYQLVLAMKIKDTQATASALSSLGHMYTAIGDLPNALASHKQALALVKQIGDRLREAREIGNVGAVYLAMGEFDSAIDCHTQHLRISRRLGDKIEEARAFTNLGSSHHYKRNFKQAMTYHKNVLRIAREVGDKAMEARGYAGLGHATRCAGDLQQAKLWHQRQLDIALTTKDKTAEGRACSCLGIVYHLMGDHDAALKLQLSAEGIFRALGDKASVGRACGNIGNAYNALGYYEQAIQYHKMELAISKEVNDRSSEANTHGNLAVAYQAMQNHESALRHYRAHLAIARELHDAESEACALLNLANCLASKARFDEAVPYYENYLMLSQELHDVEGEAKACHFLGYAHYCLENHREAVRYYDQDLALAKDLRGEDGQARMGKAYCNLGLAHLALGNIDTALECQKYYLAIAHMTTNIAGKFRALGNIGECLARLGELNEAIKMHQRQLSLARQAGDRNLEAAAYGALGLAYRTIRSFDKALGFHTQELTLKQEESDLRGECRAHGNIGAVHMGLGQYTLAVKCYQEQLERARELADLDIEAQALGNLGIAQLNMAHYDEAINYFEQELVYLEQSWSSDTRATGAGTTLLEKIRALGNLGDCYVSLGQTTEAISAYEQQLAAALQLRNVKEQEKAYRGLGRAREASGNHHEALVCFEKILMLAAHEADCPESRAAAYGDLGRIHASLRNYEQSVSCLTHQLTLARGLGDKNLEGEAASSLGAVHLLMDEPSVALQHHELELAIAENLGNAGLQARACANLATTREALGQHEEAIRLQQQSLSLAAKAADLPARATAFAGLGRLHHLRGDLQRALSFLQSSLALWEGLGHREEVARLYHRIGFVYWANGDAEAAFKQLEKAAALLDSGDDGFPVGLAPRIISCPKQPSRAELLSQTSRTLQKILVSLGRNEEALGWAENARRSGGPTSREDAATHYSEIVDRQRGIVIYYSEVIEEQELYGWCLAPGRGLLRFVRSSLAGDPSLAQMSHKAREALLLGDNAGSEMLNLEDAKMPARGNRLNASSYSLSSLFSLNSISSRTGSVRWAQQQQEVVGGTVWQAPAALQSLYELLLAPFEDLLPPPRQQLVLVVEPSLFLAPLPALQSKSGDDYLCERFSLLVVPSLSVLRRRFKCPMPEGSASVAALVVGDPSLPVKVREEHDWLESVPSAEAEANIVAELLETRPLIGAEATRSAVLRSLADAECVHLTVPVFWEPDGCLGLASEQCEGEPATGNPDHLLDLCDSGRSQDECGRLAARLVVVSSGHWAEAQPVKVDGLHRLARGLLAAGAQCILVALWPVPTTAGSILLRAFYSALLQGQQASRALAEAMQTVQHTRHFAHPANWAGWLLLGADARLSNKVALMGQALAEMLANGPEKSRDALRVTLHLVEKSLQRINCGQKSAMYTTLASIENKVGSAQGWRELLMSVGFRFEPAGNGIQSSVFFPQSDPEERLTRCSASLQALLGLGQVSLQALVRLLEAPEAAEDVIAAMRRASCAVEGQEIRLPVCVWRIPGSHELFASLGFDLMEVGQLEVQLRTGKQASRRAVQFALQALLALFDTQEAPKSLSLDSASSMESLAAPHQAAERGAGGSGDGNGGVTSESGPRLGGAYAGYVRHRGEPDGKRSSPSRSLSRLNLLQKPQGRWSRVENMDKPGSSLSVGRGAIYPEKCGPRTGSSSSGSTDWEEDGHGTVLRRQAVPPALPHTVLERLSVRSELGAIPRRPTSTQQQPTGSPTASANTSSLSAAAAAVASAVEAVESALLLQGSDELGTDCGNNSEPYDAYRQPKHQQNGHHYGNVRSLTSLTEVYHEKKLGLGLAPSLTKLLEHFEDVVGDPNSEEQDQVISMNSIIVGHSQTTNWLQNEAELCRRDEADGRSIAESQCSVTSSHKTRRKAPPPPVAI
ncbi:tetratricopeptide repeat protein 28 [Copidosoma floridanum]|uniref:tetratricopeptide repeat protein 28 n=1 Tax=Copidosoma floridanum TaxID=29053 RepID=UPI000C6F9463|nr:tetratricopeptide repeat protein 28 [Copidosoma floridanum]